ncbi:hypothetical protein GGR50DRAFT_693545 [Xylaria sp. CBS 124048]|nr:hypothetical protein GGR50DRAFT_693545 [Xylaria sp. CBS 124048]
MMASVVYGANAPQCIPLAYPSYPMLDDFSSSRPQRASPESYHRTSRTHSGQRSSGAMRVVKPGSASSSPQSTMARRRTVMNDGGLAQRRQEAINEALLQQMQEQLSYMGNQDLIERNSRPVSWHPSSQASEAQQMHLQIPQVDFSQYAMGVPATTTTTTTTATTTCYPNDYCAGYQNLPPTPAAYSGHTSPVSGFSPLLVPYGVPGTQSSMMPAYITPESSSWMPSPQMAASFANPNCCTNSADLYTPYMSQEAYDWNEYSPRELESYTAPPTPDGFQMLQQSQMLPSEGSIPYQPLEKVNVEVEEQQEEEEEEGEILVGMGLYDTPGKIDTDPELDYYRTTTSHLLNSTYRDGKGWKLEESWEPPATDDEEEEADEEEDEEDEDGEDEEKAPRRSESPQPAQQSWI